MKKLINFSATTAQVCVIISMTVFSTSLSGQCMMIPLSLEAQMAKSDVVIEGEVISRTGFETVARNFIYTNYQIRITKIFKGQMNGDILEMIEPGGVVGTRSIQVDPGVRLDVGESGTFFLSLYSMPDDHDNERFRQPIYRAHGSMQSVFRYDFSANKAIGVFMQHSINSWYDKLQKTSGRNYQDIQPLTLPAKPGLRMVPSISGMSPLTITAGTYSVLTITGSGFGSTMGTSTVEFKNADDGGASWMVASAPHMQTWSNTQIQLRVPYRSGSGQVRVIVGGIPVTSSQSLSIGYSHANIEYDIDGTITVFQRHHYNNNGSGGYTFRYYTGFNSNNPARESFMRAVNSWRCATDVNFRVGSTTTINDDLLDGVNIVRFDVGSELAEGVGAHCVSYLSDCALLAPYWSTPIQEIDLVFNDAFTGFSWEYGPALPSGTEIDFESIALHELGHAHALGHVISSPEVMHYSIGPSDVKRVTSSMDVAGGVHVHAQSTGNPACNSFMPMTDYNRVRYVDHIASGTKSGDSWANALTKLQDALLYCPDSIHVAMGTYYPDEGVGYTNNDETHRFLLNSPTVLLGGYPNGGGTRNLAANQTILSGDIEQDGLTDAQNSQNVMKMTSNSAVVDGFVIERGYADAASGNGKNGGGLYNQSNGVVRNTIFRNNKAVGTGSDGDGGAVYHASGFAYFHNVVAYGNEATRNGSAFWIGENPPSLVNCTITKNLVGNGAIYVAGTGGGGAYLPNNILWNNGIDLVMTATAWAEVSYSMFDDATLPGGAFGDNYLLNTDPQFVNPGADNYAIVPCSPATNTGWNANNPTTIDVLGNPRFVGGIDRGAFENTTGPPSTVVTSIADNGPGSLRTTIANACSGNTITFSPSLAGQTIVITGTQFILNKNLIIQGLGLNQLFISGNESRRIFNVNAGITATIRDMTLVEGNSTSTFGNCIRSFGILTLQNISMSSYNGAEHPYTLFSDDGTVTFKNLVMVK